MHQHKMEAGGKREETESKFDICLELSKLSILRMGEKSNASMYI